MREIKFRGWDIKNKIMFDVNRIDFIDGITNQSAFNSKQCIFKGPYKEVILMQYTGLKDKNGKEIYEGDIVEYLDASGFSQEDVGINRGIVELDFLEGINFTNRDSVEMEDIDFDEDVEIIGNIYENQDLLNK